MELSNTAKKAIAYNGVIKCVRAYHLRLNECRTLGHIFAIINNTRLEEGLLYFEETEAMIQAGREIETLIENKIK